MPKAGAKEEAGMPICSICKNDTFGAGPCGRMSVNGSLPRCESCQSLERHRSIRGFFNNIRNDAFAGYRVLQFSNDLSIDGNWFNNYEISVYGGASSLDLQKIDRESDQYDFVICNHVLEHVRYDNAALNELVRIINNDGVCFLTTPDPFRKIYTQDWDYPDDTQHGHYRVYGEDIVQLFQRHIPHAWVFKVKLIDEVTQTEDCGFLLAKRFNTIVRQIETKGHQLEKIQQGYK